MIKLNDSGVIFAKVAHTYTYNGKRLSGITGKISEYLGDIFQDIESLPEFVQNNIAQARDYGSAVHAAIEDYFDGDIPDFEFMAEVNVVKKQLKDLGLKMIASEYSVTDREVYASCIDAILVDKDNNIYLGDFKTAKTDSKKKNSIQLSIYKRFFELINPHLKVKGCVVLRVNHRYDNESQYLNKTYPIDIVSDGVIDDVLYHNGVLEDKQESLPAHIETLMNNLASVQAKIKEAQEYEKEFRKRLEEEFRKHGVDKLENDLISISVREGYTRKGFDKKNFEKNHPELAVKYETKTEVKPSIMIKLK